MCIAAWMPCRLVHIQGPHTTPALVNSLRVQRVPATNLEDAKAGPRREELLVQGECDAPCRSDRISAQTASSNLDDAADSHVWCLTRDAT